MSAAPATPSRERVTPFSFTSAKKRAAAAAGGTAAAASNGHGKPHGGKTHEWEFMGPPGAAALIIGLPLLQYAFYFACNGAHCVSLNPYSAQFMSVPSWATLQALVPQLWSTRAAVFYAVWFAAHVAVYLWWPATKVKGDVLLESDGLPEEQRRLEYPLNGFASLLLSLVVVIGGAYSGLLPLKPTFGYDEFIGLLTAATLFANAQAVYLYVASRLSAATDTRSGLAPHGQSGNALYDFFIGRTLNPRIGRLDLKFFCELRPGLVLWLLLDLSMAARQYERFGYVTASMVLVCAFQGWYVFDALWAEQAILSTMDIKTDGFGWMLSYGDLAWVPFVYSLQARYLADHPTDLGVAGVVAVLAVKALGFWIFRGSNNEKDEFRSNPSSAANKHHTFITTRTGSRLLTSGWWGMSRHINYFGDWLMGVAWCLPTGFGHPLPYFYALYFATLLIHRERRDDKKCGDKYGPDWVQYCKLVPYRIIPYVY